MSPIKDVYNLECKIFERSTADLSQKDIKGLLKELYACFPYTQSSDGNKTPYETDNDYSKKWFQAYNHLLMIFGNEKTRVKASSFYMAINYCNSGVHNWRGCQI